MSAIAILALVSGLVLCCGIFSFGMMFNDVAPSQNSYAWPYLIPAGLVGLLLAGVTSFIRWLA